MTLPDLVFETFAPDKALHGVLLVWQQCWRQARLGRLGMTNGDIARSVGLRRTQVCRCLAVLRRLGLVDARRTHGNSGFDLILVTKTASPTVIEGLQRVARGDLTVDVLHSRVVDQSGGEWYCNTARPVLEVQFPPGVHFVNPESSDSTSGTDLAFISNYGSTLVTKTEPSNNHQENSNWGTGVSDALDSAVAGPASQPQAVNLALEVAALRQELQAQADKKAKASAAARKAAVTKHTPTAEEAVAMTAVFEHWRRAMGYPDQKLTQARREDILARLRSGFEVAQLCQIIDWASTDDWRRGRAAKSTRTFDDIKNLMHTDKMANDLLHVARGKSLTKAPSLLGKPGEAARIRTL